MKDICTRETYKVQGQDKVRWNKIGILFTSGEKEYIKLYHMPGVLLSVFEQKKKETAPKEETPF